MTRILTDVKLDFRDVLFVPQRSELESRSEVDLNKSYTFKHSQRTWSGIPIIAANMDGVGTFEVAKKFIEYGLMTSLVKHYHHDELYNFFTETIGAIDVCTYSLGISNDDLQKFELFKKKLVPNFVTIDVANGYSQKFIEFVKKFRESNPDITLIAGNVATAEMTSELILAGVDVVKVGIGCFTPESKVRTDSGLREIRNIKIGEKVLTHTGSWKRVTNTYKYSIVNYLALTDKNVNYRKFSLFSDAFEATAENHRCGVLHHINGITCTENHEFYVVNKKDSHLLTDDNIHQYASWIPAHQLDKTIHLLLEHV